MTFAAVQKAGQALSGVEESTFRGYPALKFSGRLLACPALHKSAEPDSIVVSIDPKERSVLLATEPDVYYLTEHYKDYPSILVRLSRIKSGPLKRLLEASWRFVCSRAKERRPKWEKIG